MAALSTSTPSTPEPTAPGPSIVLGPLTPRSGSSPSPPTSTSSETEQTDLESASTQSSSSHFGPSETPRTSRQGRKRVRQVHTWKSTLRKERRNCGQGYTTKKGATVSVYRYLTCMGMVKTGVIVLCCFYRCHLRP